METHEQEVPYRGEAADPKNIPYQSPIGMIYADVLK